MENQFDCIERLIAVAIDPKDEEVAHAKCKGVKVVILILQADCIGSERA